MRQNPEVRRQKSEGENFRNIFLSVLCLLFILTSGFWILTPEGSAQPPSPFAVEGLSGKQAPAFSLKDTKGNSVSSSSLKGKVVLLNFWATWCPPCRAEMPSMSRLSQLLRDRGLVVIGISTDRSSQDVLTYLRDNPVSFPILLDTDLQVSKKIYKVFMAPTTFLIDRRGVIIRKYFGEQDWTSPEIMKEIEALL
ncbi:MAG: TlpA disulfide reductase family protein [Thermodesulfovibrionales bacterium]|jgi:peroxiredoxin